MRPMALFELLDGNSELEALGVNADRMKEAESVDNRWVDDGYFLTLSMAEILMSGVSALSRGPRTLEINVHHPWDDDRDYAPITQILNCIDRIYLPVENFEGSDGIRITGIRRIGRSKNQTDEGWRTITRQATYGVLYDEYAD